MSEAILVAIITGILAFAGTVVSNNKNQSVMDTKLDELTREVREHNNFARRMPVVEEQIRVLGCRISNLEEKHKDG